MTPEPPLAAALPTRRSQRASAPAQSSEPALLSRAERRRLAAALGGDTGSIQTAETAELTAAQTAETEVPAQAAEVPAPTSTAATAAQMPTIAETVIATAIAGAAPLRRRDRRAAPSTPVTAPTAVLSTTAVVPADIAPAPAGLPDELLLPHERLAIEESVRIDEFERAAQLFAFDRTLAAPRPDLSARSDAPETSDSEAFAPEASAPAAGPAFRRTFVRLPTARLAAAASSVAAMGVIGLFAIGTTTPASVVSALGASSSEVAAAPTVSTVPTEDIQAYVAASNATVPTDADRQQDYKIASMADLAAGSGVTKFSGAWVNDPNSPIQWPFAVGVPISAGYGASSYLSSFGTEHKGVDFTPGEGAAIQAVADGTVRIATEAGGGYGVTVVIDHVIDGQLVSTRYGHMQYGSLGVEEGQTVKVGDVIGTVGSTGKSTGPHLHLEVLLNGTETVDPYQWLVDHT